MYIKIHNPKDSGGNAGSSGDLVSYLDKENKEKSILDKEYFFSHYQDDFSPYKVQQILDSNKRGLKNNETKFYMITINPSEKELRFLNNDKDSIRSYTRIFMDEYAKAFDRNLDGRKITGSDLVYFAKIEDNRSYKPEDFIFKEAFTHNQAVRSKIAHLKGDLSEAVDNRLTSKVMALEANYKRDSNGTIILPGNIKDGLNTHVHIIVSRKDQSQRLSLSPLANSKGSENILNGKKVKIGFERTTFVDNAEKLFDKHFGYDRSVEDSYEFKHARKHNSGKYISMLVSMNGQGICKQLVLDIIDRDKEVKRLLYFPKSSASIRDKIVNKSIDKISTLIAGSTPQGAAYSIAKKVIIKTAKAMTSGIDIGI